MAKAKASKPAAAAAKPAAPPASVSKTAERVSAARVKLTLRYPFYGIAVMNLRDIIDESVETAGTDGRTIMWAPSFVGQLDDESLMFILAHEVMHCMLQHVWRRKSKDAYVWNVSCDAVINAMLKQSGMNFRGPKGIDGKDFGFPEAYNNSADEIYAALIQKMPPPPPPGGDGEGEGEDGDGEGKKPGRGQTSKTPHTAGLGGNKPFGETLDNHKPWREAEKKDDKDGHDVSGTWEGRARVQAPTWGKAPAGFEMQINKLFAPKIDWRSLLHEGLKFPSDYSWRAPYDRRSPGFLKPRLWGKKHRIIVAIDTSGSTMGDKLIEFWSELNGVLQHNDIHAKVILCDAAIQAEMDSDEFDPVTFQRALGGGGTDFRPVFMRARELIDEGWRPEKIVYLTDLDGPFPDPEDVAAETLWVVSAEDAPKADKVPFGYVIPLVD